MHLILNTKQQQLLHQGGPLPRQQRSGGAVSLQRVLLRKGLSHHIESRFQQLDLTVADDALEQPEPAAEQAAACRAQSLAQPVRRSPRKRNR